MYTDRPSGLVVPISTYYHGSKVAGTIFSESVFLRLCIRLKWNYFVSKQREGIAERFLHF